MTASEPSLPGAPLLSNDCQESGLWLWHGETPPQGAASPPASPAGSSSRVERIADLVGFAARRARWMGPPTGWFLVGLAAFVMAHALSGDGPIPANTLAAAPQPAPPAPAAAPQPGPSPSAALPASPTPPTGVPVPQLGQASEPSGSIAQRMARRNEHIPAKWPASRRPQLAARRVYPLLVGRAAPVFPEPCRYQCDDGAEGMTWHGGGY
jgi:hypothetical protein